MDIRPTALPAGLFSLLASLGLSLSACSSADPSPTGRVFVQHAEVNGHPASLLLDTGAEGTVFFHPSADRLELKTAVAMGTTSISKPAQIALGGDPFTAQVFLYDFPWYLRLYFSMSSLGFDGSLGWPELREGILVFDPVAHIIKGADEVPAETAGWLKLKITQARGLHLETPLSNGQTGTIAVDTGNPYGVALSPALWDEWRAAHPQTPTVTRRVWAPSGAVGTFEEAWADEVQIGELKLTDVPVHRLASYEASTDCIGGLGLYALCRMNLVLDGKNSIAYIQPKPAPGPPYISFDRPVAGTDTDEHYYGNWSADNLHVSGATLQANTLQLLALHYFSNGDTAQAIAIYTQELDVVPHRIAALLYRGIVRLHQGDQAGALADLKYVDENAQHPVPAFQHAYAKLAAGDFSGALTDYDHAIGLSPVPPKTPGHSR